jgi:hypothetical protein
MRRICHPDRALHRSQRAVAIAVTAAALVLHAATARAQVLNPGFVEFLPPPEHHQTLPTGQRAIASYQVDFYSAGSNDSMRSVPIGRPAPQADGMIRVTLAGLLSDWPNEDGQNELRVTAIGPNGVAVSDPSNRFVVDTAASPSAVTRLGDVNWTSMTNGWGPAERNRSNGETGAADGLPLTLAGRTYASGLGVHAGSTIRYALGGACSTFEASIGIDDEIPSLGSVVFQVWSGSTRLYQSPVMTAASATQNISVDISGRTEIALTVTDAGDGPSSDHADWADARVTCTGPLGTPSGTPPGATYISDGPLNAVSNGWGPLERDRSNGELGAADGRPLTLDGNVYAKGLGVHAGSEVRYPLNGACTVFQAIAGVDDEVGALGSVVFQVFADGNRLFDSGVVTGASPARVVRVDVTGRRELVLRVTDGGNGNNSDHADWAEARLSCTGGL